MTIRGSVDFVTVQEASGWAFSSSEREKLTVQALLNNEIIGEGIAEGHRSDLAAAGLGDGNCGYSVKFYRELNPLYLPFVVFKIQGGDVELPRSNTSGLLEFFRTFYNDLPISGRHRSLWGGLWTDRLDAAALLRGKALVGNVADDAVVSVGNLITHGFTLVESHADTPDQDLVLSILDNEPVLKVLHAVLEDEPLVLKMTELSGTEAQFGQVSAEMTTPSPNECLVVIAASGGRPVEFSVVRDSHSLPEFTAGGSSRWAKRDVGAAMEVALQAQGMLDHYVIPVGACAIIGPGTLFKAQPSRGAMKLVCCPQRVNPLSMAGGQATYESEAVPGTRIRAATGINS